MRQDLLPGDTRLAAFAALAAQSPPLPLIAHLAGDDTSAIWDESTAPVGA